MDPSLILRGLIIGFSIAAPVGPIGVLCIRRTLAEGRMAGLATGLGAASADGLLGCVAVFGLTFVSNFLLEYQEVLRLVGGLFLCFLGVQTFLSAPAQKAASAGGKNLLGMYGSTFFLTLTNPLTLLAFAAILAGLGLVQGADSLLPAIIMVAGVFLGSAAWWFILSGAVGLLRERFSVQAMRWVNRLSGLIILGFGLAALLSLL